MKKIFRRNKPLVFVSLTSIIIDCLIYLIWVRTSFLSNLVKVNTTMSKNLMTIDTVLIGFSYTALNTMLSFSNNINFNQIDKDGYIDKYYNGVYITITLLLLSLLIGFVTGYSVLGDKYHCLYMIQLLLNLDFLIFFGYTIIKFRALINWVRRRKIAELTKK